MSSHKKKKKNTFSFYFHFILFHRELEEYEPIGSRMKTVGEEDADDRVSSEN